MAVLPNGLQYVACWVLIVAVVQEERLVGQNQYWLTRPYLWKRLLAAKALFLIAFINVPLLICQSATLISIGISPLNWLPALFWRQIFFTIFLILPALGLAATTRSLGQAVLAAIVVYVQAYSLLPIGIAMNRSIREDMHWFRICSVAVVILAGVLAVLLIQYSRRRTVFCRVLGAVTILTAQIVAVINFSPQAMTIQRFLAGEHLNENAIQLSFDPAIRHVNGDSNGSGEPPGLRITIPLRIDNLPAGMKLYANGTLTRIEGLDRPWESVWNTYPALRPSGEGQAWFMIPVESDFFQANKDATVRLHATVDFTVYRFLRVLPDGFLHVLPSQIAEATVPEIGTCWIRPSAGFECASPHPQVLVARFEDRSDVLNSGRNMDREQLFSPLPTAISFRPVDLTQAQEFYRQRRTSAPLALFRPVARIRRTFDTPPIRLSEYYCTRVTVSDIPQRRGKRLHPLHEDRLASLAVVPPGIRAEEFVRRRNGPQCRRTVEQPP